MHLGGAGKLNSVCAASSEGHSSLRGATHPGRARPRSASRAAVRNRGRLSNRPLGARHAHGQPWRIASSQSGAAPRTYESAPSRSAPGPAQFDPPAPTGFAPEPRAARPLIPPEGLKSVREVLKPESAQTESQSATRRACEQWHMPVETNVLPFSPTRRCRRGWPRASANSQDADSQAARAARQSHHHARSAIADERPRYSAAVGRDPAVWWRREAVSSLRWRRQSTVPTHRFCENHQRLPDPQIRVRRYSTPKLRFGLIAGYFSWN